VSASRAAAVTLRPASAADCRQIWRWRNDAQTRRASLDPAPIPLATHERWFARSLESPARKLYVVVAGGRDAGVVRLDLDGGRASVSIHLAPERRGQGLGPAALAALADLAFGALGVDELVASVKRDNRASLSAFARAGFSVAATGAVVTLARARGRR
jgi:RimJ/RimL family protein N-acetyltransferase